MSFTPQQAAAEYQMQQASRAAEMALRTAESHLDAELQRLDNMGEEDMARLRQQRKAEMQRRADNMQRWRQQGHGTYSELGDQKDWFEAAKKSERMVTHFYRGSTWRCELVDKHIQAIAAKHLECRFVKIDAEKSPFLSERLQVVLLPTLVITENNFTKGMIEGFQELGNTDKFTTRQLEKLLAEKGAIEPPPPDEEELERMREEKERRSQNTTSKNRGGKAIYGGDSALAAAIAEDSDPEFWES
jgi:hypothetical protein